MKTVLNVIVCLLAVFAISAMFLPPCTSSPPVLVFEYRRYLSDDTPPIIEQYMKKRFSYVLLGVLYRDSSAAKQYNRQLRIKGDGYDGYDLPAEYKKDIYPCLSSAEIKRFVETRPPPHPVVNKEAFSSPEYRLAVERHLKAKEIKD